MQDEVIRGILSSGLRVEEPWVVYTAGAMGAGKSYTLRWLDKHGYFPLSTFVSVDPDAIKCELPEMKAFIKSEPDCASSLVHKESGYIAEIAEAAAFDRSFNLLVDGSLRDHQWYRSLFRRIRRHHKNYRIAILHVTARPETVYQRAGQRSESTGRVVPKAVLDDALYSVPRSVQLLAPYADFVMEINNDGGTPVPLTTEWQEFAAVFAASTSCVTPAPPVDLSPSKQPLAAPPLDPPGASSGAPSTAAASTSTAGAYAFHSASAPLSVSSEQGGAASGSGVQQPASTAGGESPPPPKRPRQGAGLRVKAPEKESHGD